LKKIIIAVLLVALLAGGAYAYYRFLYVRDARDVYLSIVSAAMLGDEEAFLDGFTKESKPLVGGLLALSRGDDARKSSRHPYYYLVTENIESVEVEGDKAWVKLRRASDQGSQAKYDVPLVRDGNSWKIDALQFTAKERVIQRVR
jgi:hypothetical protein